MYKNTFFFKIIPPDEDNDVENCMASELGHLTSFGPIRSFKPNNCHVTQQDKQNWPIGGCAILYTALSLYEIIKWHHTHRNSLYNQGKLGRAFIDTIGTAVSEFLVLYISIM